MSWLGYKTYGLVDDLLNAEEFEVSDDAATPLSVWYGGMLEACANAPKVIGKLV